MNKDNTISNNRESWKSSDWSSINWKKVERKVFKLQCRIYKSTTQGDIRTVRKLQKTLIKSWSGKLIAVKRVTTDNRGKKTAGIDGIKSLNSNQKLKLAQSLILTGKSKPVRRIWIPKSGSKEKRPLGIPVMEDRAKQALVKLALEPEWEAKFENKSYGFRPGKNTQDAIKVILGKARKMDELWILDADIKGCFDNINHDALLKKINQSPQITKQIKAWLKCGVIDWNNEEEKGYKPTLNGVPQGGTISPLLSNIALHGLEKWIKDWIPSVYRPLEYDKNYGGLRPIRPSHSKKSISVVRYADDFVVLHKDEKVIRKVKQKVAEFLEKIGLKLNNEKTKIVNIYEGFDFLGFNVRRYNTGKYHSDKDRKGNRIKGRLLIKPSKEKVRNHYKKLAKIVEINRSASQKELIQKLNPIIAGWANYYKYVSSTETFGHLDHILWRKIWSWCTRRHNNQKKKKTARKYFPDVDNKKGLPKWKFYTFDKNGRKIELIEHNSFHIKTYHLVDGKKSPYNGDKSYWGKRLAKYPFINKRETTLLKIQNGKCNICKTTFKFGEQWHIDHINPKKKGGKNYINNLQLLHNHCHISKTILNQEY